MIIYVDALVHLWKDLSITNFFKALEVVIYYIWGLKDNTQRESRQGSNDGLDAKTSGSVGVGVEFSIKLWVYQNAL